MSENSYYESADEDEYMNSTIEIFDRADEEIVCKNKSVYFFSNPREFVLNICPWTYNNTLTRKHIDKIKEGLKKDPILTGVFSTVLLDDGSLILIDGHHRHAALKELYQENFNEDIEIEVHCYKSDLKDSEKTINLFRKLNNIKPFPDDYERRIVRDKTLLATVNIISKLKSRYNIAIRENCSRANFPYLHGGTLNSLLQNKLETLININTNVDAFSRKIVRKINQKNEVLKENSGNLLTALGRNTSKNVEKMNKTNCYLAILPMDKWIGELCN